jgi:hypothetical protein
MPNHVHVVIEVWRIPLGKILHGWKSYTSKEANRILGCRGTFWAEDYFDRYIRNEEHLSRAVRYIEHNPLKAGLVHAPEDFPWSSARYRSRADMSRAHTDPSRQPASKPRIGAGTARPPFRYLTEIASLGTSRPFSYSTPILTSLNRSSSLRWP